MMSCPCKHVLKYKALKGLNTYKFIHSIFVSAIVKGSRKRKAHEVKCKVCNSRSRRVHACLDCAFFGCMEKNHMHRHASTKQHNLAVDVKSGNIFCFECNDYTYDDDFLALATENNIYASKLRGTGAEVYRPWEPTQEEVNIVKANGGFRQIAGYSPLGLRGLVNLGQTCFMNCILQVLIHTPSLRNYFLSDQHICHFQEDPETSCLGCVMANIFQEFYSGVSTPYVPHKLVYVTWTNASHLVGYAQQDAQEFYIALLEVLDKHCKNEETDENLPSNTVNKEKTHSSIINQVFKGLYQSDLVCLDCKNVSTTFEAFSDISLDLGSSNEGKVKEGIYNSVSLMDCIERYTRPETLPSQCGNCSSTKRTKQITMKNLPVVITFHLKRLAGNLKKNSTHVSFPEYLDMSPFTTESCGVSPDLANESYPKELDCSENKYALFAVVNHIGTVHGGHYVSFIRQNRDSWYQCNDDVLSRASINEVLASEGYLLFYHKRIIEYGENPTLQSLTNEAPSS